MITNIPTPEEFEQAGIDLLNMAWDTCLDLCLRFKQFVELMGDEMPVEPENVFWKAARRRMASALSLVQQGTEFILKGQIAYISPFLLLHSFPNRLPKGSCKRNVPFAEFRTIDSQDLPVVHDTVCGASLSQQFNETFDSLRNDRNAVMHTVDSEFFVEPKDLLKKILQVYSEFSVGAPSWIARRRAYLETQPDAVAWGTDSIITRITVEFDHVVGLFSRKEAQVLLKYNKQSRRYLCPGCSLEVSGGGADVDVDLIALSYLQPNTPSSQLIHCPVCEASFPVKRASCCHCSGNVICSEDSICLTCFKSQDRMDGF